MADRAEKEISQIGINDEIGGEISTQLQEQLTKEIQMHKRNLVQKEEGKIRFGSQLARDIKMWDLMLSGDNYKRVTPMFKYEEIDEYWELAKGQLEDKINQEKFVSQNRLVQFDIDIDNIKIQLEDCETQLNELLEKDKDKTEVEDGAGSNE